MDRFYKHSLSSSSIRSGSSSLPNSFQQPLPLSMAFAEDDTVAVEIGISEKDVPQPLDCLQGTPIPPFLSKTFDLVDDPKLDHIISWRDTGASFVVGDPVEFSRTILPRNFKHNNLSSFVRQLNTYGFRKIDTDRWEFACENFLRGKKHLLKNIHRRKSLQSHQVNEEYCSLSIEAEVERLQKEKIQMMQEVIELKNQQRGTQQYMESLNEKLQAAEDRQKQMVSSLAKVFHGHISSPRNVRKFFKHQKYNQDCELEPIDPIPVYDTVRNLDLLPLQLHQIDLQELAQTEDPIPKEESLPNLDVEATEGYLLSSAVNLVKQEDIWSPGFENIAAMPSSSNKIWNDVGNYEFPEIDVGGGELSDFWNLATASDGENWSSDETSFGKANQYGF